MNRPPNIAFLGVFMLLLASLARAQSAEKVSLCDLVTNPQKYSSHWVEVRGTVNQFFEDFSLETRDCGDGLRGIWLAYGGDENTPVASTVNDHDRKPGSVLKVSGIPVTLLRDANLDLFKRRLSAQREIEPDGSPCYDKCPLYRVTATLTGLFLAAPAGQQAFSGYGHMGCCHLLAIRQVTDVDAKRTKIPAGGKFACTTDTWDMNAAEAGEAFRNRSCRTISDCLTPFRLLVQHWRDDVDLNHPGEVEPSANSALWRSADLLTTYKLDAHYRDARRYQGDLLGATATRTTCRAVEPPYSPSTPISCEALSIEGVNKKAALQQTWLGEPAAVAPFALDAAVLHWRIHLLPGLVLQKCDKPQVIEGEQFTTCVFREPTSMQSLSVDLKRSRLLHQFRGWKGAPWKLWQAYGLFCTPDAAP